MDRFINTELLLNPYNWIVVILMLLIGVIALGLLQAPMGSIVGTVQAI